MKHRSNKKQGTRKRNVRKNGSSIPPSIPKKPGKRKVNTWREEDMLGAIQELKTAGRGLRRIARAWRVPKSTLERRVKRDLPHKYMLGKKTLFSNEQESQLEELLLDMARRGFPLTEQDVRKLAFQYAKCNRLSCRFSERQQMAGYYWMKGFLSRHPRLTVKSPEALSAARATGMNKPVISQWFDNYEKMLSDLNIKQCPANIWNLDESGFQDYFLPHKAVGEKGVALYQITGAEKGETVTVIPVFNAMGDFGPLMVIFKAGKMKTEWAVGSPPNTIVRASKDGYINSELFVEFGRHFVQYLRRRASNACKNLLVLDGHSTHTYNVEFLTLMRDNNVEVICLPPHATHALQPADKALFASMKSKWEEAGRRFVRESGGRRLDKREFFAVFTPVWKEATTVEVCQNGFRATGLFPCNRDAIPDNLFSPSLTTDREQPGQVSVPGEVLSTDIPPTSSAVDAQSPPSSVSPDQPVPSVEVPSTSSAVDAQSPPSSVSPDQPVPSVEVPSTSSAVDAQSPPSSVSPDQPVPSVEVPSTSSAVDAQSPPSSVSPDQPVPSVEVPSTSSAVDAQSPPSSVSPDQPVPSVEVPSTSSAVDAQSPPSSVSPDQPVPSVEVPSTSSAVDAQSPPSSVSPDQPVPSVEVPSTSSAVDAQSPPSSVSPDQPVSLGEGVPTAVSFYDIQPVPTRERGTKRKRRPLPSAILTSDDHFNFLSTKKKKPEPKKAKREPKKMDLGVKKQRPKPKNSQPDAKKHGQGQNATDKTSEDRTPCLYCEILYCNSNVDWVQCKACRAWVCATCAHVGAKKGRKRQKAFVCDSCK